MADNIIVDNGALTDYTARSTEVSGVHVQHVRPDLDAAYTIRIDEGATYTYIGHAATASAEGDAVWRIKRMTNADTTILWADGNGSFDNIWDDRTSLSYS